MNVAGLRRRIESCCLARAGRAELRCRVVVAAAASAAAAGAEIRRCSGAAGWADRFRQAVCLAGAAVVAAAVVAAVVAAAASVVVLAAVVQESSPAAGRAVVGQELLADRAAEVLVGPRLGFQPRGRTPLPDPGPAVALGPPGN